VTQNSVWFTTNLALPFSTWTSAGAATVISSAHFQFTAAPAPASRQRFYRVTLP
jgi:hypothetical protein